MKLFCSYAFTGEDPNEVNERMRLVVDTLEAQGHQAYCARFDETALEHSANNHIQGVFEEAFKNLADSEALVVILSSAKKSLGQIMELGAALSQKKPIYLLEHKSAIGYSYLPRLADEYLQWETEAELRDALQQLR